MLRLAPLQVYKLSVGLSCYKLVEPESVKQQVVRYNRRSYLCGTMWFCLTTLLSIAGIVYASGQEAPADEITQKLSAAVDHYYLAQFPEASALLKQVEAQLNGAISRREDLRKLRLYQALIHAALDEGANAAARFKELLAIDPGFSMSENEYPSKIRRLFDDVKRSSVTDRCRAACSQCEASMNAGDLQGAASTIIPLRDECECVRQLAATLSDTFLKRGKAASEVGDHGRALQEFKRARETDPSNVEAPDYLSRTAAEHQRVLSEAVSEWQRSFQLRDYARAKAVYERVLLMTGDGQPEAAAQIRWQYESMFDNYSNLWSRACRSGDALALDALRQEVRSIDPTGNFNRQILRQVQSCPPPVCPVIDSNAALTKLRNRVYPEIDKAFQPYRSKISVKIRIDEKGEVAVLDIDNPGANRRVSQAVRDAVRQWRFDATLVSGSERRCAVTEFLLEFER